MNAPAGKADPGEVTPASMSGVSDGAHTEVEPLPIGPDDPTGPIAYEVPADGVSAGRDGVEDIRPSEQAESNGVKLGRLFGVPIYGQPGWLLLAALLLTYVVERQVPGDVGRPASYLLALSFAVLLYASVLVHELAHSVVALSYGMRVRRINLHLLGGVSEIEEEAPTAGKEFAIAFAGPAFSFVVFGVATLVTLVLPEDSIAWWLTFFLARANLVVGIFNLLPGLPLDGGRVLQAGVWQLSGSRHVGVVSAAWGGRVLAAILVVLGVVLALTGSTLDPISLIWTVLIAAFLWAGATTTLKVAKFRKRLPSLQARVIGRRAIAVAPETPVAEALRRAILSRAQGILVLDATHTVTGLVSAVAVRAMPEERRVEVPIADLARRIQPGLVISADSVGEDLLKSLQAFPAMEYVLVEADGSVFGVLMAVDVERATAGW